MTRQKPESIATDAFWPLSSGAMGSTLANPPQHKRSSRQRGETDAEFAARCDRENEREFYHETDGRRLCGQVRAVRSED